MEGIIPEGEGEATLLVRQAEVQRIRNRLQLSALAREFVDVVIVSQERFEDARFTLRTWIDTQRKPLGELKVDNLAKPLTKAQKRKASKMATGRQKKKKNTAEPDVPPPPPPPPQVYVIPPFVPPLVPVYPQVPLAPQPMHEEGSDDVVMLRRVPPPSPFTPSLPLPPPSGIACLSQGVHSSQAMSSAPETGSHHVPEGQHTNREPRALQPPDPHSPRHPRRHQHQHWHAPTSTPSTKNAAPQSHAPPPRKKTGKN